MQVRKNFRTIRTGVKIFSSMNISMLTTERGWGQATKQGGPGLLPGPCTSLRRRHRSKCFNSAKPQAPPRATKRRSLRKRAPRGVSADFANSMPRGSSLICGVVATVMIASSMVFAQTGANFVQIDAPNTVSGYLARLLINEVPFPGERAYVSETETQTAMVQILWVLHSRLRLTPAGYRQEHI